MKFWWERQWGGDGGWDWFFYRGKDRVVFVMGIGPIVIGLNRY